MRCADCRRLLQGLIEGDLKGDDRREAGRHLAECPECAALLEQESFWDEALLRHFDHELPPDLRAEILGDLADVPSAPQDPAARLERPDGRRRWRLVLGVLKRDFTEPARLLRVAAAAAAAVAVLLLVDAWTGDPPARRRPFTQAAPIVTIERADPPAPSGNPPTGRLSLPGRLI